MHYHNQILSYPLSVNCFCIVISSSHFVANILVYTGVYIVHSMLPLSNKYVENLDEDMTFPDQKFKSIYVEQILNAQNSLLDDMCQATGVTDYTHLRSDKLNSRNITKEKLGAWLETFVSIVGLYCAPVLTSATKLPDIIDQLKDEKIADQMTVIELQGKLIEKKSEDLASVQTTVKSELKTWSSVVANKCSKALAPRKMKAALKRATEEEDRSLNLVIYGLKEKPAENLEERVLEVLQHIDEKPRVVSCCRMGKDVADGGPAVKPIKFTLAGSEHVRQVLSKAKGLREVEGYNSVYISPDRSAEQRAAFKKLILAVKQKRLDEPERGHVIRNNKIVSSDKD